MKTPENDIELFYEAYHEQVAKTVAKFLAKPYTSKEVQDALTIAWMKIASTWDSFKGGSTRMTWAYVICRRAVFDHFTKCKKIRKADFVTLDYKYSQAHDLRETLFSSKFDYSQVEKNCDLEQLYKTVAKEPHYRKLVDLIVEKTPVPVIAKTMGKSRGAIQSMIKKLKNRLVKFYGGSICQDIEE